MLLGSIPDCVGHQMPPERFPSELPVGIFLVDQAQDCLDHYL